MRTCRCFFALLCLGLLAVPPAPAQEVLDPVIDLELSDPESWALAYFTSASLLSGLGPVEARPAGSLDLGLELIWVPTLDEEQRRVGYGGFKEEELNRSAAWARLRATLALPAGFALTVGFIPPVDVDGVEANLWSAALERRLLARGPFSLGLRLHGQKGDADGDFTCKEGEDHLFPPGAAGNPFGCEEPSKDTVALDYYGVQLVAGHQISEDGPAWHAAVSFNRLDTQFQVDAMTFGLHDRTLLRSKGDTLTWEAGATFPLGDRLRLGVAASYTALDIQRPGQEKENDPLLHVRALIRYRLR